MKRTLWAALVATVVTSTSGCCLIDRLANCHPGCGSPAAYGGCDGCGPVGCGPGCHDGCGPGGCANYGPGGPNSYGPPGGPEVIESGPPTGAAAYPYYTTRGPRDYLARSPRSIGP